MVCFPGMPSVRREADSTTAIHLQRRTATAPALRSRQRRFTLAGSVVAALSLVCAAAALAKSAAAFLGAPAPWLRDGASSRPAALRPSSRSERLSLPALHALPFEDGQAPADGAATTMEAPPPTAPLFQEMIVSNSTVPKKLMKAIVGVFGKGEKAVDLVLVDPRCKDTLMYAICSLPSQFRATAQVLLRRRDRRMRLRVYRDSIPPDEDPSPEVLYLSKQTNASSLGFAIKSRFVDAVGNNRKRTVKLDFAGREASSRALVAIESAIHFAHRELLFRPRFEWQDAPAAGGAEGEASEDGKAKGQQVRIGMTITAI